MCNREFYADFSLTCVNQQENSHIQLPVFAFDLKILRSNFSHVPSVCINVFAKSFYLSSLYCTEQFISISAITGH